MRKMSFFIKRSPDGTITLLQGVPIEPERGLVVHEGMLDVPRDLPNEQALSVAQSFFEQLLPFLSFQPTSS